MGEQSDRLFLVGGSWRAFARIDMERRGYPLAVLHEYRMSRKDVRATAALIAKSDMEELRRAAGVSEGRASLLPLAAPVLTSLVDAFQPHDIAVSSYGIREGMLYEQMPGDLRARDPLIEACRFNEAKDARLPGFGRTLHKFIAPLFEGRGGDPTGSPGRAPPVTRRAWGAPPTTSRRARFPPHPQRHNAGRPPPPGGGPLPGPPSPKQASSPAPPVRPPLRPFCPTRRRAARNNSARRCASGRCSRGRTPSGWAGLNGHRGASGLSFTSPRATADLLGEVAEARFQALADSLGATKAEFVGPDAA